MNLKSILFLLISSIIMTACSSPIVRDVRFDNVTFDPVERKTVVSAIDSRDQFKIVQLTEAIMNLGSHIDLKEANFVAREAVLFSMHLANEYQLVSPPNSHHP